MLEIKMLDMFLLLMETRSTSAAAKRSGFSQSYVSKILGQLREDLDDPLFIRDENGFSPTAYAIEIEPRVREALAALHKAVQPRLFSPKNIDTITIHMMEPYIIAYGRDVISAIRQHTDAHIELLQWNKQSEQLILDEAVDIGITTMNGRNQAFHEQYLHSGTGSIIGHEQGEFVKYLVPGFNDYTNLYQQLAPRLEPSIVVDNQVLLTQLMDEYQTLRYRVCDPTKTPKIKLDMALVTKAATRRSAKIRWLTTLLHPIIEQPRSVSDLFD
ncbi:LysR family transcriptional regulator [Vibrio neonatus]|uniref:LysR family transcriptional regulator n=1 Tax=Vibrio neonatus TaxID=278860 RepID=UPI0021C26C24|nr:LysR family transcriptional regulator [Vibrio neonatus]